MAAVLLAACEWANPASLETQERCRFHFFLDSLTLQLDSLRLEECDYPPIDGTVVLPDGTIIPPGSRR